MGSFSFSPVPLGIPACSLVDATAVGRAVTGKDAFKLEVQSQAAGLRHGPSASRALASAWCTKMQQCC